MLIVALLLTASGDVAACGTEAFAHFEREEFAQAARLYLEAARDARCGDEAASLLVSSAYSLSLTLGEAASSQYCEVAERYREALRRTQSATVAETARANLEEAERLCEGDPPPLEALLPPLTPPPVEVDLATPQPLSWRPLVWTGAALTVAAALGAMFYLGAAWRDGEVKAAADRSGRTVTEEVLRLDAARRYEAAGEAYYDHRDLFFVFSGVTLALGAATFWLWWDDGSTSTARHP